MFYCSDENHRIIIKIVSKKELWGPSPFLIPFLDMHISVLYKTIVFFVIVVIHSNYLNRR